MGGGPVTAIAAEPSPLDELPAMPLSATPVILPALLRGLGITRPRIPAWITDPDLIASIEAGLMDLPDELQAPAVETQGGA